MRLLNQVSGMPREHTDALNRKNIIEKRKEEAERREQDKAREEARYGVHAVDVAM